MNLKGRDFISLMDFSKGELEGILSLAEDIKSGRDNKKYLEGKSVGILFSVASTRTRISFQVGTRQLGGSADFYNADELQLVHHESLTDTAAVMGRYLDLLVVRMYDMNFYGQGREALNTIAKHADIPIINALDDKDHPCQVMGDILTLKEKFGKDYKNKKVVFTWGYAKRQKSPGVPQSMLIAASLLGMNLTLVHPEGFDVDDEYVDFARRAVKESGGKLEFGNDLMEASQGADVIYVKSWKSLKMSPEQDIEVRNKIRNNWCVSDEHFNRANPGAYFMNCLPIIRGEQATADVIDGEYSIIYDEAENRLHVQKSIMATFI
jgi:ornithine carbamoyltransferase